MGNWLEENWVTLVGWILNFLIIWLTSKYSTKSHEKNLKFDEKHNAYKEICDAFATAHQKEILITELLVQLPTNKEDRKNLLKINYNDFADNTNKFIRCVEKYAYILNNNEIKKLSEISDLLIAQGHWYSNYYSEDVGKKEIGQADTSKVDRRNAKLNKVYLEFSKMINNS